MDNHLRMSLFVLILIINSTYILPNRPPFNPQCEICKNDCKCDYCASPNKNPNLKKQHLNEAHGTKCPFCEEKFYYSSTMVDHRSKKHPRPAYEP